MFGISMWEVVLILVVALVVLGPRQLTEVARALGKMYREVQKLAADVRSSVDLDALTRNDAQPEPSRRNYEPPPAVKNHDILAQPDERSGPDFYADLLESSKEPEDKASETGTAEESAAANAKPDDAQSHDKSAAAKDETQKDGASGGEKTS